MDLDHRHVVEARAREFRIAGRLADAAPCGTGHINDSYVVTSIDGAVQSKYFLQRINEKIFDDPVRLMENVARVTAHIAAKLAGARVADAERRRLTLVETHEGGRWVSKPDGSVWRMFRFLEQTRSYESAQSPALAYEAGRAFGGFQALLADLPAPRLHETLPDFHHTPKRYERFHQVLTADAHDRAAGARQEIGFALRCEQDARRLVALQENGQIPERITHNDAKISNVLFDAVRDEALCVVDLDTVMPGTVLHDFGDMVRSMVSASAEDERDLSKVAVRLPFFEALARGYLEAASPFLTEAERQNLVFAGKLITLEQGVRFLTDYLDGDTYYRIHRPGQNLDRCRTQFTLVDSIQRHERQMQALIWRH